MAKRSLMTAWLGLVQRSMNKAARKQMAAGAKALQQGLKLPSRPARAVVGGAPLSASSLASPGIPGVVLGATGARRFWVYRPPEIAPGERLPLLVMLHGCGQTAAAFALSTRMNQLAASERFLVLYPEQDRLANPQGCWNWYDTASGKAYGEAGLLMRAIDQVCLLHPVDRERIAVAGLSAGASMAALLVTRHPGRFKALVMHSGVPPGTAHSSASAFGAMHGRRSTRSLADSALAMGLQPGVAWPPLLVIHGGADRVVAADNAHAAVKAWADAAGARAGAVSAQQRGKRYPMKLTRFKAGRRTAATLVEIEGLGHAWSGGAKSQAFSDPLGPDASRMVWRFVRQQMGV
jgi:poly(hydroxyalkanoate) depolymerase family esterase